MKLYALPGLSNLRHVLKPIGRQFAVVVCILLQDGFRLGRTV
jgi:hypothetical protein